MYKLKIESFREYEGLIHEHVTRYRIIGITFGHNSFSAGPFQTLEEAEQVQNFITSKEAQS